MRIWMHTIGYPPEQVGGMEVHARDLAEALTVMGYEVHVTCLSALASVGEPRASVEERNGVHLHRIGTPWANRGDGEHFLAERMLRVKPDLAHFHPLFADGVVGLVEFAAKRWPVFVSYHTPPLTCVRGDLLYRGGGVCDGRVLQRRCSACVLHQKGLAWPLASLLAHVPLALTGAMDRAAGIARLSRLRAMFGWPHRIARLRDELHRLWHASTKIIAVCDWLRILLRENGVPAGKIAVCRVGRNLAPVRTPFVPGATVRLGYMGRLTREKGVEVLLEALRRLPGETSLQVEFCSPDFEAAGSELAAEIGRRAKSDPRIVIGGNLAPATVAGKIAEWDALLVPSVWMETGPQVVTEAFLARTPVIGSRRGGILELVQEGVGGVLLPPGDVAAWAACMRSIVADPAPLRALRVGLPPSRTATQMAEEMSSLYRGCVNR